MRSWGQKWWVRLRSRRKTILGRSEGWWFWSCSTRWTVLCASRRWSWKLLQSSKLQYSRLEEIRAKMPPSRCKWSDNVLPRFDFVHTFSESANSQILTCHQGQFLFYNYHLLKNKYIILLNTKFWQTFMIWSYMIKFFSFYVWDSRQTISQFVWIKMISIAATRWHRKLMTILPLATWCHRYPIPSLPSNRIGKSAKNDRYYQGFQLILDNLEADTEPMVRLASATRCHRYPIPIFKSSCIGDRMSQA